MHELQNVCMNQYVCNFVSFDDFYVDGMDSMKHDTTPNDTKPESETFTEAAIFHQIQSNLIEFVFFRTKRRIG